MKISCVIPTRDRAGMLATAIASVLAQDVAGVELVVVDDGSVDGTEELLVRRFPQLRRLRLPGLGPGPARNAGVAAAEGDVIMFLDSDDLWTSDHAGRLCRVLRQGYAVAYGTTRTVDRLNGGEFLIPEPDQICEGDCFTALLRWCFLVPSALAVSRQAFERVGGFSAQGLGEDWGFALQLAQNHTFGYAGPGEIARRQLHAGSLCRLQSQATLSGALQGLRDLPWDEAHRPAARARFNQLLAWLAEQEEQFSSVQAWYQALRRDRMI
jgi:hypothetical protein